MRTLLITITLSLLAAAAPRISHGQPAAAQAQVLFDQGIKLMDDKKFGEACAAFDASDKLEPEITTLLNRADCREQNGQFASAWGLFLDAERQTRAATDAATQQFHLLAIDKAAKLEPRLSKLTVNVPPTAKLDGLEIRRGADVIDAGAWGHPLPIDGGKYTVSATAPNYEAWATTLEIAPEHDSKSVEVVPLKKSPPKPGEAKRAKLPYLLAGGAAVLLGVGLAFELSAESSYDASKNEPDDAKQNSEFNTADHKRYFAEGIAAGGLALAGVAVWRFLRHGTVESEPQQVQISIVPTLSGTGDRVGVVIGGRF